MGSSKTKIEWTATVNPDGSVTAGATWQPITGCSVVSPGCTNCYAMGLAGGRLQRHPSRAGLTAPSKAGPVWTGEVRFNEQWLDQPLRWREKRRIFVCAHGDLFHENVPDEWIDRVFAVMALAAQHIFIVLTKRASRMREYFLAVDRAERIGWAEAAIATTEVLPRLRSGQYRGPVHRRLPIPNVWLMVSAEDQQRADERIPELLATPAAVRGVSLEPLLGPIDLTTLRLFDGSQWDVLSGSHWFPGAGSENSRTFRTPRLDWVIIGGESGKNARPMLRSWALALRDQCATAGVPFFFKQHGEWIDADEWLNQAATRPMYIDQGEWREWQPPRPLTYRDAARTAKFYGRTTYEHQSDGTTLIRVGKRAAGRRLDGREHSEFPR